MCYTFYILSFVVKIIPNIVSKLALDQGSSCGRIAVRSVKHVIYAFSSLNKRYQISFLQISSEDIMAYQDFRRRCNSFYMEVVSQLCFAEGTPPCDEVVEKLLSFITIQTTRGQQVTKELTVFDDCIDPTPVVRSFLLQHLIRTR